MTRARSMVEGHPLWTESPHTSPKRGATVFGAQKALKTSQNRCSGGVWQLFRSRSGQKLQGLALPGTASMTVGGLVEGLSMFVKVLESRCPRSMLILGVGAHELQVGRDLDLTLGPRTGEKRAFRFILPQLFDLPRDFRGRNSFRRPFYPQRPSEERPRRGVLCGGHRLPKLTMEPWEAGHVCRRDRTDSRLRCRREHREGKANMGVS